MNELYPTPSPPKPSEKRKNLLLPHIFSHLDEVYNLSILRSIKSVLIGKEFELVEFWKIFRMVSQRMFLNQSGSFRETPFFL